jgi:PAS domain-containing protein
MATAALVLAFVRTATGLAAVRSATETRDLLERTAAILDAAGDGIAGVDLEGRVTFLNAGGPTARASRSTTRAPRSWRTARSRAPWWSSRTSPSERRTHQILETAHDAFVAIDASDTIIDWTRRLPRSSAGRAMRRWDGSSPRRSSPNATGWHIGAAWSTTSRPARVRSWASASS